MLSFDKLKIGMSQSFFIFVLSTENNEIVK